HAHGSQRFCERRALPLSCGDVLQYRIVQHRLREQLLQPSVLFLELLKSSCVWHAHAAELRLPRVERWLRYTVLTAKIRHLHPGPLLTQDPNRVADGRLGMTTVSVNGGEHVSLH